MTATPATDIPPPPSTPPAVPPMPPGPAPEPVVGPPAPPAPPAPEDGAAHPAEAPSGPTENGRHSALTQILTPVQPARPVLGTTADRAQAGDPAKDTGGTDGRADANGRKDPSGNPGEGPVSALLRALAARLGRTGTATTIRQQHSISENRVSGNSSNTTSTNKTDRLAKNDNSSHSKTQRDAKTADLNNKTHQHQGRDHRDDKRTHTNDAKNHANRDRRHTDSTDSKSADSKSAKSDNGSKSTRDNRNNNDHRSSDTKATDSKSAKSDNGSKSTRDNRNNNDHRSSDTKATDNGSPERKTPAPKAPAAGRETPGAGPESPKDKKKPGPETSAPGPETKTPGSGTPGTCGPGPAPLTDGSSSDPSWMEKARKFLFKPGPAREHGEQPTAMPEPTDTKPGPGVDDKGHGTKWPGVKAASPGTDNKPPDGKRGPGGPETPRDVSRTKASGPGTPQGARAAAAPPADDAKGDPARLELVKHMLFAALGLEDEPAPPVNAMPEPATTKSAGASTGTGDKGHGTKWPGAKAASPSTDNKPPSAPAGAKASSLLKPGPGGTTGQGVPPKPTYPPSPPAALRVTPARPTHGGNTAQNDGGEGVKGAPKVPETTKPVLGTTADRRGQSESPPQIYPAEPATVLAVSGKGVEYEFDGEAPKFKTRGEIRSLKAFTRAMTGKQKLLASHSDRGKKIKAEAGELASEVGNLRDAARTVHGGERLLKRLDQLHEAAKLTSAKAVDMDTALHKGSETVRTLITNADARHGIIFRAVVDSDLTEPAEREFYLDKEGS